MGEDDQKSGKICLIEGPMFSGKSGELIRLIRRYFIANKTCCLIKHAKDLRYSSDSIRTHDDLEHTAISATRLYDVQTAALEFDVIGIDEGQFFEDVVSACDHLADRGKIVIVAMLNGTFDRKPFPCTVGIEAIAEEKTMLTAVCVLCFGSASFSKRLGDETDEVVIGGKEKYAATCRACHKRPVEDFSHLFRLDALGEFEEDCCLEIVEK